MKILLALLALGCLNLTAQANTKDHSVKGYTKKDGTYVAPHRQTNPNKTEKDNYGTKGNTNPSNGKEGTRDPKK
jgi:hypothetical protein